MSLAGFRRVGFVLAAALVAAAGVRPRAGAALVTASEAIRASVSLRMGAGASVTVRSTDVAADAPAFREARPDPAGRIGQPMRFTLLDAGGRPSVATALVSVVVPHVVVRQPIARGQSVLAGAIEEVRTELTGTPVTRLPTAAEVVGARALRPIARGLIVLPGFVVLRRAVESGDVVSLIARVGEVEVAATCVAIDGGRLGDTIRLRHPNTRTYVRGRVISPGVVEVVHGK